MSFYRHEDSIFQQNESIQDGESQAEFLKGKLIQTHKKLLKELENNKIIQAKFEKLIKKNQLLAKQNMSLANKIAANAASIQRQKSDHQKTKILEDKIEEAQRKNDLLRVDLQSMRAKMLGLMMQKSKLEQQVQQKASLIATLDQENSNLLQRLKLIEKQQMQIVKQIEHWKKKFQQTLINNQDVAEQYNQLKRQNTNYNSLKIQRQKNGRLSSQLTNTINQLKDKTLRLQKVQQSYQKLKQQSSKIQIKCKTQNKVNSQQLQKVTLQLNQIIALYKQKQKQLEQFKKKPLQSVNRKRQNLEHTKELVMKLEVQQSNYMNKRVEDVSKTPNKSYKEEKQDYITMIEEVGEMQTVLLECNLQKKKLLSELDKIDNTKVKTKELIAKRRKIDDEISKVQHKIDQIKLKLRKLKVI